MEGLDQVRLESQRWPQAIGLAKRREIEPRGRSHDRIADTKPKATKRRAASVLCLRCLRAPGTKRPAQGWLAVGLVRAMS
jgi:hypothetical protein